MRRLITTAVLLLALTLTWSMSAHATGTPAGTSITNTATANYTVGGTPAAVTSNTVTVKVAEILNVAVTWQDATSVTVAPSDTNKVLTFRVTNTGNGSEKYLLSVNTAVVGDNFDPTLASVYLDANANGVYDAGTDTLFVSGTNDPVIAADGYKTVFVLSNIPGAVVDGNTGNLMLTATANTGSGAAGTVFVNGGDGGTIDAIVGTSTATQTVTGTYLVSSVTVSVVKSAVVSGTYGTNPVPGATITYTVTVTVTGTGTATSVVITDPIPANTTYTANTLKLNTVLLTDGADADAGNVTAGTVTVALGSLTSASLPMPQVITFAVTIN
ncbi:MAG: DUF11 domain-containing protein [Deltaproteobacteria bacterium]|nr:DUF11 domain-containing protein [Deltaproteobacteria bacterium]